MCCVVVSGKGKGRKGKQAGWLGERMDWWMDGWMEELDPEITNKRASRRGVLVKSSQVKSSHLVGWLPGCLGKLGTPDWDDLAWCIYVCEMQM